MLFLELFLIIPMSGMQILDIGCCVGKDSKAKCVLREKEYYEWLLIPAKGSRSDMLVFVYQLGLISSLDILLLTVAFS